MSSSDVANTANSSNQARRMKPTRSYQVLTQQTDKVCLFCGEHILISSAASSGKRTLKIACLKCGSAGCASTARVSANQRRLVPSANRVTTYFCTIRSSRLPTSQTVTETAPMLPQVNRLKSLAISPETVLQFQQHYLPWPWSPWFSPRVKDMKQDLC